MARLARKHAWGKDAIFHGTRYANETLRSGKLISPDSGCCAICLTRSPETAAYFALMVGKEVDQWSGAVLVLNRGSLRQRYRLEPFRYEDDDDGKDEREERIYGRVISFRRHLIGVVREADVARVLGPPKHKYTPPDFYDWSEADRAGPVAELVGIRVGVVSGVMNLESSGVEASDWRPRHEQVYHDT